MKIRKQFEKNENDKLMRYNKAVLEEKSITVNYF